MFHRFSETALPGNHSGQSVVVEGNENEGRFAGLRRGYSRGFPFPVDAGLGHSEVGYRKKSMMQSLQLQRTIAGLVS